MPVGARRFGEHAGLRSQIDDGGDDRLVRNRQEGAAGGRHIAPRLDAVAGDADADRIGDRLRFDRRRSASRIGRAVHGRVIAAGRTPRPGQRRRRRRPARRSRAARGRSVPARAVPGRPWPSTRRCSRRPPARTRHPADRPRRGEPARQIPGQFQGGGLLAFDQQRIVGAVAAVPVVPARSRRATARRPGRTCRPRGSRAPRAAATAPACRVARSPARRWCNGSRRATPAPPGWPPRCRSRRRPDGPDRNCRARAMATAAARSFRLADGRQVSSLMTSEAQAEMGRQTRGRQRGGAADRPRGMDRRRHDRQQRREAPQAARDVAAIGAHTFRRVRREIVLGIEDAVDAAIGADETLVRRVVVATADHAPATRPARVVGDRRQVLAARRRCRPDPACRYIVRAMRALAVCSRFSASSQTTDCGPSMTASVTSWPRLAGSGCM